MGRRTGFRAPRTDSRTRRLPGSTVGTGSRQSVHRTVDLAIATCRNGMVGEQLWVSGNGKKWKMGRQKFMGRIDSFDRTRQLARLPKHRGKQRIPLMVGAAH